MPSDPPMIRFNELVIEVSELLDEFDNFDLDGSDEAQTKFNELEAELHSAQQELIMFTINNAVGLIIQT